MDDKRHIVLLGYGALSVLAGALLIAPPTSSGEMAAWVQGVGTVVGVILAVWVGQLPLRQEQRRRREDAAELRAALIENFSYFDASLKTFKLRLEKGDAGGVYRSLSVISESGILSTLEVLLAEPRRSWPSSISYFYALSLSKITISAVDGIKAHLEAGPDGLARALALGNHYHGLATEWLWKIRAEIARVNRLSDIT